MNEGRSLCAALLLVVGCGRVGFETHGLGSPEDAGAPDASPDAAAPPPDAGHDAGVDAGTDGALPMCDETPCRLVRPQCGCPEGEMCHRVMMGSTTRGCAAAGTSPDGADCSVSTECSPGASCVRAMTSVGQCLRWCTSSSHCPAGTTCTLLMVGSDVGACEPGCDPLSPATSCPMSTACRVLRTTEFEGGAAFHASVCGPPAGAALGSMCTTSLDCAPGSYCEPGGACRALCDPMMPCVTGAPCTPLNPPLGELGYCP